MNRICIHKPSGKLIEFQDGDAPLGTLMENAIRAGYSRNDIEEKYTADDINKVLSDYKTQEEKDKTAEDIARLTAITDAKQVIADKYTGKKKSDIIAVDATEWNRINMAMELGLDL